MLQILELPGAEPIYLDEAMNHIKQDAGIDDAHIKASIVAARKACENKTWRQIVCARYKQTIDTFPGVGQTGVPWGQQYGVPSNCIVLERAPCRLVESIEYLAMNGSIQTVPPSLYAVDYSSQPCRITPRFGQIWPIPMPQIGSVWITFIAGFADPVKFDSVAGTISTRLWPSQSIGDPIRFSNSGGALPSELQTGIDYYVIATPSSGVYRISNAPNGAPITFSNVGTGLSFVGEIPGDLLAWMKLRIGSLDAYREDVALLADGATASLYFVDSLLDGYMPWC